MNHVFVDPAIHDKFIASLIRHIDIFNGGPNKRPDYYTHIVSDRNFDRLAKLLDGTKGNVVYGGNKERDSRFFGLTIVDNVKPIDSLLSEELFGPILPVIKADLESAIKTVNK